MTTKTMKRYCVQYSYIMNDDCTVTATSRKDAIEKVKEVVGDVKIESVWEASYQYEKD